MPCSPARRAPSSATTNHCREVINRPPRFCEKFTNRWCSAVTIAANGTLSGTPTTNDLGAGYFTVRVADNLGASDIARLQISVVVPPPAGATNIFNSTDDTFAKQANPTNNYGSVTRLELRKDAQAVLRVLPISSSLSAVSAAQ